MAKEQVTVSLFFVDNSCQDDLFRSDHTPFLPWINLVYYTNYGEIRYTQKSKAPAQTWFFNYDEVTRWTQAH